MATQHVRCLLILNFLGNNLEPEI